jgi:thiamine biosynthesis lipoprotein ApbE
MTRELSVDSRGEHLLDLEHGALATSGDSRRYLLKDGVRMVTS